MKNLKHNKTVKTINNQNNSKVLKMSPKLRARLSRIKLKLKKRKRKKRYSMKPLKERGTSPKSLKLIFSSSKHLLSQHNKMKKWSREQGSTFHSSKSKKKPREN